MITNKPNERVDVYQAPRQRLGNKTLYTTVVPNQNNVNVRYFSGIDAEIYFGDVFIDETVSINFNVQQNALPLYGYNSYIYDDIALGSRIVNGTFTINFTKASYMYQVLDTLVALNNNKIGSTTSSVDEKAPLWNKKFDIYMSYGDAKQSDRVSNSTILVLKQVTLVSCNQELDYSGKPIYETYSFVARDIDFLTEGAYQEATTSKEEKLVPFNPITNGEYFVQDSRQAHITFGLVQGAKVKGLLYKIKGASSFTNAFDGKSSKDGIYIDTNQQDTYLCIEDITSLLLGTGQTTMGDEKYTIEIMATYIDLQNQENTIESNIDLVKQHI